MSRIRLVSPPSSAKPQPKMIIFQVFVESVLVRRQMFFGEYKREIKTVKMILS